MFACLIFFVEKVFILAEQNDALNFEFYLLISVVH